MKYTLICENTAGDFWRNTTEFESDYLQDVLENIDIFLRGSGYFYEGSLSLQKSETSLSNFTGDTQTKKVSDDVMKFTLGSLTSWSDDSEKIKSFDDLTNENCNVCNLPNIVAERHSCNEPNCPVEYANKR